MASYSPPQHSFSVWSVYGWEVRLLQKDNQVCESPGPMIERDLEDLIAAYPDDFFLHKHFVLVGRQQSFAGVGRFDLVFEDEFPAWLIVIRSSRSTRTVRGISLKWHRPSLGWLLTLQRGAHQPHLRWPFRICHFHRITRIS
jgi:hypothetical protein